MYPDCDADSDGWSLAEGDCDDSDAGVHPGAEEVWYDGIDMDCANNNDFDADGDGFVPDEWIGFVTNGDPSTGLLPGGDCNDNDANSFPENSDDW